MPFLLDLTAAVGDAVAEQKKARGAGAAAKPEVPTAQGSQSTRNGPQSTRNGPQSTRNG